jgi:hypothetical protein
VDLGETGIDMADLVEVTVCQKLARGCPLD